MGLTELDTRYRPIKPLLQRRSGLLGYPLQQMDWETGGPI